MPSHVPLDPFAGVAVQAHGYPPPGMVAVAGPTHKTLVEGSLIRSTLPIYAGECAWVPLSHVFEASLQLTTSTGKGRVVVFTDEAGRTYPMFLGELLRVIVKQSLLPGGALTGHFGLMLRSGNAGIRHLG